MHDQTKKPIIVVAAVIMRDGKILICQRSAKKKFAGWWEFPGGKAGSGEDLRACAKREIEEELGMKIAAGEELSSSVHDYSADDLGLVELHFFLSTIIDGEPIQNQDIHSAIAWVEPSELLSYQHLASDKPVAEELRRRFG